MDNRQASESESSELAKMSVSVITKIVLIVTFVPILFIHGSIVLLLEKSVACARNTANHVATFVTVSMLLCLVMQFDLGGMMMIEMLSNFLSTKPTQNQTKYQFQELWKMNFQMQLDFEFSFLTLLASLFKALIASVVASALLIVYFLISCIAYPVRIVFVLVVLMGCYASI